MCFFYKSAEIHSTDIIWAPTMCQPWSKHKEYKNKQSRDISLTCGPAVWWFRIHLAMQEPQVWPLGPGK